MISQVIIRVVNRDGKCNSAPQLLKIPSHGAADNLKCFSDFNVLATIPITCPEERHGADVGNSLADFTVESF